MVIDDISAKKTNSFQIYKPAHIDRLFAAVIDFLILAPVIGLFSSGVVSDLKINTLFVAHQSNSFLIFQYSFIFFSLFVLYESVFNYFLKATPGHYFLYLRLESDDNKPLSFLRIIFRSVFKFVSFLFVFFPFIEILLREDRKPFYDRVSLTKLTTLKKAPVTDDIAFQIKIWLTQWVNSAVIVSFIAVGAVLFQVTSHDSVVSTTEKKIATCASDLNSYLVSYLQDQEMQKSKDCIQQITDRDFTKAMEEKSEVAALNYFARYVMADEVKLRTEYLKKFCSQQTDNVLCAEKSSIRLSEVQDKDFVYYVYVLSKYVQDKNHLGAFLILDGLYDKFEWTDRLENLYMQSYLKIKENTERKPASQNGEENIDFSQFKKRVGIVQ